MWSSGLEWSSPRCEGYSSCLRKTIRPLGETLLSDWQKSLAYIGPSSRPREMAVVGPPRNWGVGYYCNDGADHRAHIPEPTVQMAD